MEEQNETLKKSDERDKRKKGKTKWRSCRSANEKARVVRVRSPWQRAAQHPSVFGWSAWQQLAGATLPLASGNSSTLQK